MNDQELVEQVDAIVGPLLTAFCAASPKSADVSLWKLGEEKLTDDQRKRLKVAYETLQTVTKVEGEDLARAWFIGSNTGRDYISPAESLCAGEFEEVRQSAQRMIDPEQMGA